MIGAFERPWKLTASGLSLLLVLAGCQTSKPQSSNQMVNARITEGLPNVMGHRVPEESIKVFVGLRGFGTRISALGTSVTPNGAGLPFFFDEDWDDSVEEKLIPHSTLFDIRFQPGVNATLVPETYQMVRDLKSGAITVDLSYRSSQGDFEVQRSIRNDGEWLEIKSALSGPVATKIQLNFLIAGQRVEGDSGVFQVGTRRLEWTLAQQSLTSTLRLRLETEQPLPAESPRPRITIDGPAEDQFAINAMLLSLYEGLRGIPAPMGLSSDLYFGHVFWDCDIWMFPVAALLMPDKAQSMVDYRLERMAQAEKNFTIWLEEGRPRGTGGPMGKMPYSPGAGIKLPWESARTGKETVPGPSRFQDHITGSVLFGLRQGSFLGYVKESEFNRLVKLGATFYKARSEPGTDQLMNLNGTMSPDEHHTGDNDLYTNLLAEMVTRWSGDDKLKWVRPRDAKTLLNYQADRGKGYKQAAGVLAIYPLQDPEAEGQAMAMLTRFAPGVIRSGPAMTDSVHSIIEARFGDPDQALLTWRKSWSEFMHLPMGMFSEKRRGDRSYFLTGAGGSLQAVLYGFAGIRIDDRPNDSEARRLKGQGSLKINPKLPKAWRSMKIEPIYLPEKNGRAAYTLEIVGEKWKLTRMAPSPTP